MDNNPISNIDPDGTDALGSLVGGALYGAAGAAGGAATGASLGLPTVVTGPGFAITESTAIAGGALLGGSAGIQYGIQQGANWNLGGQIQQAAQDFMNFMGKGQGSKNNKPSDMQSGLGQAYSNALAAGKKGSPDFCKAMNDAYKAAKCQGNTDLANEIKALAKQMGCRPSGFMK